MKAFLRAVLIIARTFNKIAHELRLIRELYEMDLASKGIVKLDPSLKWEPAELIYTSNAPDPDEEYLT